ncbi:carbohydrate kinase family protein [Anthocerotibacter panamensis]|uniref:carbohydrate kinase family protein n=1 Tax=Anthocerotibacter panamensis TaxID=2857077 RepID=UPI001C407057|nr:carbohydrate kinase family protein [Anthocerotibacter panamensis]
MTREVICTGGAVVDVLVRPLEQLPKAGESATVEQILLQAGGCGVNTAILLARLGLKVGFWGRLGADSLGRFIKGQLEEEKVHPEVFICDPTIPTKAAMVVVNRKGERSLIRASEGGNALSLKDLDRIDLQGVRHLHIGGCYSLRNLLGENLAALLRYAQETGVRTSLDTVWTHDDNWQAVYPALPYVDYFLPSLVEAQQITGLEQPREIAHALLAAGAQTIVIKMGADGAFVQWQGTQGLVPAFAVGKKRSLRVVDSTGAGDAFCAGFITALLSGYKVPTAVEWGNAAGAITITAIGATTALHSRAQLMEWLI